MIRRLSIRVACFLLGVLPLTALLHVFHASSELRGATELLYVVVGGSYIAHYCVKHQDEIPSRPERP